MSTPVFKVSEVLSAGWEGFKNNAFILIIIPLIFSLALGIVNLLFSFAMAVLPPLLFVYPIVIFISVVTMSYVMFSMIKASLMILNGEKPGWGILKNDILLFLKFFAVAILFSIILAAGSVLLVIPMFLALAVIFPAQYIIINEKGATVLGSFKKSWAITKDNFVQCFVLIIACSLISCAGMLALGAGVFITAPVVLIATVEAYKKLAAAPAPAQ